jgi:hypothetical protein
MFLTLLRKDWRLAKPAFLLMSALFFTPAIIGVAVTAYSRIFEDKIPLLRYSQQDHTNLMELIIIGFILCVLTAPAVAASQFGRERRERSAEFLGALPIARSSIVASKSVITTILLLLPVLLAWLAGLSSLENKLDGTLLTLSLSSIVFLAACGIAWFLSCVLPSEVFSTAGALVITGACAFKIYLAFQIVPSLKTLPQSQWEAAMVWSIGILFLFFAAGGFVGGTIIASRRRTL